MLELAFRNVPPVTAGSRSMKRAECPLCSRSVDPDLCRHIDLRAHLIAEHGAQELADALLLARSEVVQKAAVAMAVRVTRVEYACANSPLSRAIVDSWPNGNPRTGDIAALVGEREACVLVALRRLVEQRVLARAGLGRWRML